MVQLAFFVGEAVEVWSNSQGQYLRGVVQKIVSAHDNVVDRGERVPPGSIFVEYAGSAKWIMERDVTRLIRKVVEPAPAPPLYAVDATPSPPRRMSDGASGQQVPLCKWGCGHQVQPGLTRNLNPYDTCCKKCGMSQGMGGHDPNCPGPPGGGPQTQIPPSPTQGAGGGLGKKLAPAAAGNVHGGHQQNQAPTNTNTANKARKGFGKNRQTSSRIRDTVASFPVPEIERMSGSTDLMQRYVREHLQMFGSAGASSKHLRYDEFLKSYAHFCQQMLVDDDLERQWAASNGPPGSGGGTTSVRPALKPSSLIEPGELLSFYREVIAENLATTLKPGKLEIHRKMLIRQNNGRLESFYTLGKKLGEGSFGSVHLVEPKYAAAHHINHVNAQGDGQNNGLGHQTKINQNPPSTRPQHQKKVCKTIKLDGFNEGSTLKELLEEIHIMADLDHPNVVKVFEYFKSANKLQVILELCEGGELWDRFKKYERAADVGAKEQWIYMTVLQILRALAFMHDTVRIAHKDLKPENVLLVSPDSDSLKIIDFGLAEKFQKGQQVSDQQCGTPLFSAPEILAQQPFDFKVDVWSCGVLMYHMLENTGPFPAETMDQLKRMVCTTAYQIPKPTRKTPSIPPDCVDCCLRMMEKDVRKRPRAAEILNHPWFQRMQLECEDDVQLSAGVCQILENYWNQSELKKAIYMYMAYFSALPAKHADPVRVLFTHLDRNNTGRILQQDIREKLQRAGYSSRASAGAIAYSLCRRGGGGIRGSEAGASAGESENVADVGYTEFLAAVCSIRISTRHHELIRQAFDSFDRGRKGYLETGDFAALFKSGPGGAGAARGVNNRPSGAGANEMLLKDDFLNGGGKITYDEFLAKMRQVGATRGGEQLKAVK